LKTFLGRENVTSRSLQELEENRFSTAELYGKLANLYPDLSDRALHSTGKFKSLTGSDPITGEHKFQRGFLFTNYSKQCYSCNKVPMAYDDTDAFYRRWVIINFPNKFEGEQCDVNILTKLITPDELSGLFNLAIEALRHLLTRGTFSNHRETDRIREEYIRKSDSVQAFIMDRIESAPSDHIEKKQLYQTYCEYCRQKNYPAINDRTFFKRFLKHVNAEEARGPRPEQARILIGIRLKDEDCTKCDAISNDFPTLVSLPQKENKIGNSLEHPSQPAQNTINPYGKNRKPICSTCYKSRQYERLGLPVLGQLPGDLTCQDCGRNPATLLIDLGEFPLER